MLLRPEKGGPVRAAITGVHGYLPDYVMTNAEMSAMVDTSDQWIVERTGIRERRILKVPGVPVNLVLVADAREKPPALQREAPTEAERVTRVENWAWAAL